MSQAQYRKMYLLAILRAEHANVAAAIHRFSWSPAVQQALTEANAARAKMIAALEQELLLTQ